MDQFEKGVSRRLVELHKEKDTLEKARVEAETAKYFNTANAYTTSIDKVSEEIATLLEPFKNKHEHKEKDIKDK